MHARWQVKVEQLAQALLHKKWRLAVAESCTGGGLAYALTSISGSSKWFDRGFITYSNAAKRAVLDVPKTLLAEHGAVSRATVKAMVEGILKHSDADVAIAITGIAGPTGGSVEKPVGLVWFAAANPNDSVVTRYVFAGDREEVRIQAIDYALDLLLQLS